MISFYLTTHVRRPGSVRTCTNFPQRLLFFPVCILSLKLAPFHYVNDIFGRNISLTVKKPL